LGFAKNPCCFILKIKFIALALSPIKINPKTRNYDIPKKAKPHLWQKITTVI